MQKHFDKEWRIYSERCVAKDATVEMRMAERRAFYAGAYILYELIMAHMGDDFGEFISDAATELNDFRHGVINGSN